MGDRPSVDALYWRYISWTRNKATHAGNGREFHLVVVSNVKVNAYSARTRLVLSTSGTFGKCVFACPTNAYPLATLRKISRTCIRKIK